MFLWHACLLQAFELAAYAHKTNQKANAFFVVAVDRGVEDNHLTGIKLNIESRGGEKASRPPERENKRERKVT